jgi:hypothetical protein
MINFVIIVTFLMVRIFGSHLCWGPIIIGNSMILRLAETIDLAFLSNEGIVMTTKSDEARLIPFSSLHSFRLIPHHPAASFIHAAPSLPCPVAPIDYLSPVTHP